MGLFRIFSDNVEIEYKSYFLSKAMLFTFLTTVLNIVLPFVIAYRSRGFWLNSNHFYEQPTVRSTFDYLLIADTEDASLSLLCGDIAALSLTNYHEYCSEVQIQEYDYNRDNKNDMIIFKLSLYIPKGHTLSSILLILSLDFHLTTMCPLQMQSMVLINKEFAAPSSGLKFYGNLDLYQTSHLPCSRHIIDTVYNASLFNNANHQDINSLDSILQNYLNREVITKVKPLFVRSQNGNTGTMNIEIFLKIPEVKIVYTPSILQELRWAWPQYLSLVVIFYWIFNKIKRFVYHHRLLMAWEIVPWKNINKDNI